MPKLWQRAFCRENGMGNDRGGSPDGGGAAARAGREAPLPAEVYVTSTEAQNSFGRVMETVARGSTVFVTRHNAPQAVVISVERYEELTRPGTAELDALTREFDDLLAGMQTPEAGAALRDAFAASPDALGRAAVAAAGGEAQ